MKKFLRLLCMICAVFIALFAVACNSQSGNSDGGTITVNEQGENAEATYTDDEQTITDKVSEITAGNGDASGSTTSSEETKSVEEQSAAYEISTDGEYYLSGDYTGGITIKKGLTVHLFLDNANISSESGDALSVKKGGSVTITLMENSANTITSSGKNGISSNSPVVINGTGTLTVNSTAKNGVKVDASLTVVDATLNITAVNHGISAYNVNAENCTLNVITENSDGLAKDGIHAEIEDPATEDEISSIVWTATDGFVILQNVDYTCNVQGDGIQADTFVYVKGGTYNITTSAYFVAYSQANISAYGLETDDFRYYVSGGTYRKADSASTRYYAMAQSAKGIKVGEIDYELTDSEDNVIASGEITNGNYYILIEGGTFTINSVDDAIHTNGFGGGTTVNDGTITISTVDDGIHSDGLTKISGGTITVNSCYEGIEGAYVEIHGGTINITALDDGINAASDNTNGEYLNITGGVVVVNAEGDGLDSNGTLTISGGKVYVFGPTNGGNASIDSDKGSTITGGTVVATCAEMMDAVSSSGQYMISKSVSGSKGSTVTLKSGNTTIVSFTLPKSCSHILISDSAITSGGTYTLTVGSSSVSVSASATSGGMGGGGSFTPGGQGGFGGGMGGRW